MSPVRVTVKVNGVDPELPSACDGEVAAMDSFAMVVAISSPFKSAHESLLAFLAN